MCHTWSRCRGVAFPRIQAYYDFWEHVEHASHATYFFTFLAQKLCEQAASRRSSSADKKHAQIALGVTSSSLLATLLLLALYYPVSAEEPALKSLLKKQGLAAPGAKGKAARSSPSAKAESKSTTVEVLLELVGKVAQPSTLIGLAERSSDIELDIEARPDSGEADGAA